MFCIVFFKFVKITLVLVDKEVKLFAADKNYILKEVQSEQMNLLLPKAVSEIISCYNVFHNPLGLQDELTNKLDSYIYRENPVLNSLYHDLAGFYRYQNADNQLELLFDGLSHREKFIKEWQGTFLHWIQELCMNYTFMKTLLGATVYYPGPRGGLMLESRIRAQLIKQFNLKIYKYKGIHEFFAA